MKRAVFRYVEAELYDYHKTKRDLQELRRDILEERPSAEILSVENAGRDKARFSDSTSSKAIRLVTNRRMNKMAETVEAIDNVLARLPEEKKELVELKYFQARLANLGVAERLNISLRTFYRWRKEIVLAVAVEMGLANAAEISWQKDGTFGG